MISVSPVARGILRLFQPLKLGLRTFLIILTFHFHLGHYTINGEIISTLDEEGTVQSCHMPTAVEKIQMEPREETTVPCLSILLPDGPTSYSYCLNL